jgi:hypothetical protein
MITKLNRNNTNFQIAYFVAGSCHTADAAYIALISQRDERKRALDQVQASKLKQQAMRIRCERKINSGDEAEALEGQAELIELETSIEQHLALVDAAEQELAFINLCIEKVQPLRRYSHMSDAEASEACQAEEWARELQYRAENFMLTMGTIPHDHFATMRQHPQFNSLLLPRIEQLQIGMAEPGGYRNLLATTAKTFDLPALIGLESATEAKTVLANQIEQ